MELEKPELVFGLVGAVGVSLGFFASTLEEILEERAYAVEVIQLSDFLRGLNLTTPLPPEGASEYVRLTRLMDRGDEFRQIAGGESLALLAAAHINSRRPDDQPRQLPGRAFVIRQLKHPDEVEWLRRIYGPLFHLLGLYSPKVKREHHLRVVRGLSQSEVADVINRDEGELARWGQQLRSTFHLADAFIEFSGDYSETEQLRRKLDRFLRLLFGDGVLTPSKDEFGMSLAHTAALRSGDLSRQVGAAILSGRGEVLAVGMNDVPRSGGGLYWEGDSDDCRDLVKEFDSNETMKRNILEEVLPEVLPGWKELTEAERSKRIEEVSKKLGAARIMNLTEFGRAVHAEMEAIAAAARVGTQIDGTTLYTTTFPCHNCAKHIVAAGIKRVVYIEPYPKSLALDLHSDSIALDEVEHEEVADKVRFEPFVGIAPRRYEDLFSTVTQEGKRLRRKAADGTVRKEPLGIRMQASPLSYIERESAAAILAAKLGNLSIKEG